MPPGAARKGEGHGRGLDGFGRGPGDSVGARFAHARREVPLHLAAGLPVAADLATDIDLSPFANSAMDGYAVRACDLAGADANSPVELAVIGHEAAGHVFEGTVEPGCAVRIMTGAPMPAGADAVVKYEIVEVATGDGNEGSTVRFSAPAQVGDNVREAGLEAHAGEVVMRAGEVLAPAGCGLLASAGVTAVPVHRAPVVGVLSIGTELVAPIRSPGAGRFATPTPAPFWPPWSRRAASPGSTASRAIARMRFRR